MTCGEARLREVDVEGHSNRCDAWSFQWLACLQVPDNESTALVDGDKLAIRLRCEYHFADHALMTREVTDLTKALRVLSEQINDILAIGSSHNIT